ncbi:MAG: transcription termination factor NusA [Deltaproteobacteria bacterium]|nr:transcription termination factor NusA [Deltaproteobacteria bacterium]
MIQDLKRIIEQVSRDKGIERDVLISTLEEAMRSAARKKFGHDLDLEVAYNDEFGEIEAFQFKEVVDEVTDSLLEISLDEGRELDPDCEIGDSLGIKLDTDTFGRIAAQSAKQVIIQKMKDAEREMIYEDYKDRIGEVINGIVQRLDRGGITVNLGRAEAVVPYREQVPRETYRRGDRIRALVLDVNRESRGPQIILSRTHPDFLANLFSSEVPEIAEGIVTIMAAVREPGSRAKIAVTSKDPDIDPVGACVGMKGSRVQSVVQELRGEKIDIIEYNPDPARYVVNALAPAVISKVVIDQTNRLMEVIVPDDQLSLAIGKRGQNVRLASKLAEWRIDVKSEAKYQKSLKDGYDSLLALPGVGDSTADNLYEAGFAAAEDLAGAQVEELVALPGLSQQKAVKFIEAAKVYEGERKVREAAAKEEEAVAREKEAAAKKEEAAAKKEEAAAKEEEAAAKEEEAALKEGYDSLLALPGVGGSTADNLSEAGFASAEELAGAQVEELVALPGLSQQKAVKLIEAAKSYAAEQKEKEAAAKDEEAGEPEETTAE